MVEVDADRAEAIQKEISVSVYPSIDAACAVEQFSIAFICSPSRFHIEQAIACAEKGMDLFIEKPLSHTLDGVDFNRLREVLESIEVK